MAQGVLPFKYEAEKKTTGTTALAKGEDTCRAFVVSYISLSGEFL